MDPIIRPAEEAPVDSITTLRQAIKDAEAKNDETAVLRLEGDLRVAEQAARSAEKSEIAPVPPPIDHASHIAELRKAITVAEARNDESVVLRLEGDLRAIENIIRLRQAIKDAEAKDDEPEVLRLEDELRAAEQAVRSIEKTETPPASAPVPASVDHASHIAELRKAIAAAEARNDEPAVLRLEGDLRAVEQEMNMERAKAAHAEKIAHLRQAIKDAEAKNDEPEVLRLEAELRAVESSGPGTRQEVPETVVREEEPVVPEVMPEPAAPMQTPSGPKKPEEPRTPDRPDGGGMFAAYPESPTQTPESDYSRFAPKPASEETEPATGGMSIEQAGKERFARMAQRFNAAKDSLASGIEAAVGNAILKSQVGAKLVFYAAFATPELIAEAKRKGVTVALKAVAVAGEAKAIVTEKVHATGSYMEERIAQVLIPIQARYESAAQTTVDLKDHFIAAIEVAREQHRERRERVLAAKAALASKRQQLSEARRQLSQQTMITS